MQIPYRLFDFLALVVLAVTAGCATPRDAKLAVQLADVSQMDIKLPAEHIGILNLEQAIERASAGSAKIAGLVATVNVVSKQRLAAGDMRDPELRVGFGEDDGTSDRVRSALGPAPAGATAGTPAEVLGRETGRTSSDRSAYRFSLRVFPRSPWARNARISEGSAKIYAAVADLLQARWALDNDLRRLFAELHFLDQDKKLMDELTEIYRLTTERTRQGYDQGHRTIADVMTASRRYLRTMSDRDEITRRRANRRRKLAALVAISTDDLHISFDSETTIDSQYISIDPEVLEAQALNNRRDLAALYWRKAAAQAALAVAKANRKPWLTFIEGSFSSNDSSMSRRMSTTTVDALGTARRLDETLTEDDGEEDEWGIRTGITLPIFPGMNHDVDVKQAVYRRAAIKELRAHEQIKRELRDAMQTVSEIAEARERYRKDTDPLIQEMDKVLEGIKNVDGLEPMNVSRLRGQILESRRLNLETELEYRSAVIKLEEALGIRLGKKASER